ncbi:MAG: class I SAM-dependent methyltransferase [Thermoguttaceae bacterium]
MFDDLADVYDAMIDWPKRLQRETPFYRRLFDEASVGSVVDVACGTGRHAALFHSWGLTVEGADLSPVMIERSAARFGRPAGLRWVVRGFEEPIAEGRPFDAAVCVGNSLALASDLAAAERAIGQMLAAVREGGLVVVQVLNLWRLPEGPCQWQKCQRVSVSAAGEPSIETIVLKGVHRWASHGCLELAVVEPATGRLLKTESTPLLAIEASELERMALNAGARAVALFGGYDGQPYDRRESVDLVMVARV